MKLIEFKNVKYSYSDEDCDVPAVKGVSFSVEKGEFVAVLGHNGSGKSTLAKLANGIYLPTEGKVFVKGIDTADEAREFEVRSTAGVVLQNPDNQIVASIVEEDVAFGPENLGIPPREIRERVDEALRQVRMTEYAMHETHRLSGGQKQRVAIAGIIAMRPECIILDEPTAMLDPQGRREVLEVLNSLCRESDIAIILITHYMEEAVNADRIILMNDGLIVSQGTPREIFAMTDTLDKCGLAVPEITKIAELVRKQGIDFPAGVLTLDEFVNEYIKQAEDADART